MDTVYKLSQIAEQMGYPLQCIGIPKTVDNDLPETDNCPGYGSAAKYNAVSLLEASRDLQSMCWDSTKVFVMETMGRHTGWLAAATALSQTEENDPPHLILLPERPIEDDHVLARVDETVAQFGYCVIAVSEGVKYTDGSFLANVGYNDAFGNLQLGGVGDVLQRKILEQLGLRTHGAKLDYCQRSARHLASRVDVEQAIACGKHAVQLALEGANGQMVTIHRENNDPYQWSVGQTEASRIANHEKAVPDSFISADGLHVTQAFMDYCRPLIAGEETPPYQGGIPQYARLQRYFVPQKLAPFSS